jgi:hypothetical protein
MDMKSITKLGCGVATVILLAVSQATAVTIAQWTFETSQPLTEGPISPEVGSGTGTASIGGTVFSAFGNGSPHSWNSNGWDPGDYWQFQVSTLTLAGVILDWDQCSSANGPGDFMLEYSTDGSSFATNGSAFYDGSGYYGVEDGPSSWQSSGGPNALWHNTVDLSSVTALDNQSSVYFRLVDKNTHAAGAAYVQSSGTDAVDNFTVSVIPEPSTVLLVGAGLLGLLAVRRKVN